MTTEKGKVTEMSWVTKVLGRLNLNEEGKVGLFGDKLISEWNKQIRDKKRTIAQLEIEMEDEILEEKEKLTDLKEEYAEAFLTVDVNRIATSDKRTSYVESFTENLLAKKNRVLAQEQVVKDSEDSYKSQIEEVQEQIDLLEEFKSNL